MDADEVTAALIGGWQLVDWSTYYPDGRREQPFGADAIGQIMYSADRHMTCHLARANPQGRLPPTGDAMALFLGPEAYVSPSWYPAKQAHHRVVPTWNYAVVQAWGRPRVIEDPAWLARQIRALTEQHEQLRAEPWAVADAPETFIAAQIKGIVGIEIPIDRLEGKCKASQDEAMPDRLGTVRGLREQPGAEAGAVADQVQAAITAEAAGRR